MPVQRQQPVAWAPWPESQADSRALVRRGVLAADQVGRRQDVPRPGERSPRFPIGVATSTSGPAVRSRRAAGGTVRPSGPRGSRADRPPAHPIARRPRPRPAPRCGASGRPRASRQGTAGPAAPRSDRSRGRPRQRGTSCRRCARVRTPLRCRAPSQPCRPAQRAALGWRVGQLERTHHVAVPQQPSGPHPPRLPDRLVYPSRIFASCRSEPSSASSGPRRRPTTARSRTAAAADAA